jgi:hypothetical protein
MQVLCQAFTLGLHSQVFALIGMQIWAGKITKETEALKGTTFAQLGYYMLNFNSFLEALFTLFHLNVINNYNGTAPHHCIPSVRWYPSSWLGVGPDPQLPQ